VEIPKEIQTSVSNPSLLLFRITLANLLSPSRSAEKVGQLCQYSDIFLPNYRLLPEYSFHDALHDVLQSYEYLITVRGVCPSKVLLLGVSSGGGLIVRLLQTLAEYSVTTNPTKVTHQDAFSHTPLIRMPMGAVLLSPFVDYTEPQGSFVEYTAHDLIVNQSVFEVGIPYFEKLGDSVTRRNESPVYRSFKGLPPICIVVSEHEVCFDQVMLLYDKALADFVEVELAVWKYMPHVFPLLCAFVPEGVEAFSFVCQWMNHRILQS
jgi:monoterpene epsilon-lactone hydrolase